MPELSVPNYIQKCANEGIDNPVEIIKKAKNDYVSIEDQLKDLDRKAAELRPQKAILLQVFKTFDVTLPKANKRPVSVIPDTVSMEELDATQSAIVVKFCEFLQVAFDENRSITAPDIREGLGIKVENDSIVYSMIKWLGINNFIKRREGIYIIAGDNWENRPTA